MSRLCALAALGAALLVGGCGKDLVVGGQRDVDTYATGDGTPEGGAAPAPALAPSLARAPGGPAATHVAGRAQGTVAFDATVELVEGGAREGAGSGTATVRIDGHDTVLVARGRVPEARYTAVRVTFTRVQASVASGLVIGGVNLTGLVTVAIAPGAGLVVERPIGNLGDDDDLLIDLDASAWLSAANPATRLVPGAAFSGAVKVRVIE